MIIWRGRGIVIALVAFACLLLSEFVIEAAYADDRYYQSHGWPKLIAFWSAAALVYAFRSWLGVGQLRTVIDKDTGQEIRLSSEGALFFVPARFWPAVLVGLGFVFLFVTE